MAWIESHSSLEKHHKVIRLRLAMRWSKNETIGFLHRFWWTVLEVSPSGDITALSSPEVMGEMLDMPATVMAQVLKVMEDPDPKQTFLDRRGGRLLVHDWLDFAGRYLADSKFRRAPEKYAEIQALYGSPPSVGGQSSDSPRIVGDTLPTLPNQTKREDGGAASPAGPSGFKLPVRSEEAVALAAERKPRPKPAPKEFDDLAVPMMAAKFFWESYVKEWSPQAKEPSPAGFQAWARDIDLMFRVDKRTPEAFNELLDWIDRHPPSKSGFTWRKNVLCPATLRQRWNEGKFADFLPSELRKEEFR